MNDVPLDVVEDFCGNWSAGGMLVIKEKTNIVIQAELEGGLNNNIFMMLRVGFSAASHQYLLVFARFCMYLGWK